MKHLFASLLTVVCFATYAQFPSLPYNPDENGDGLIGVVDLQGLLANYGNEFASAVVSEDGESAIVYMGNIAYPQCKYSCDQLPGFWALPELEDLVPVWDEVYSTNTNLGTWVEYDFNQAISGSSQALWPYFYSPEYSGSSNHTIKFTSNLLSNLRCYCAAKQLPRVEYSRCEYNNDESFDNCTSSKVADGWYPLQSIGITGRGGSEYRRVQSFWRWAE